MILFRLINNLVCLVDGGCRLFRRRGNINFKTDSGLPASKVYDFPLALQRSVEPILHNWPLVFH